MKFLEVELCYLNTNLVQENFNRSAAAACPACPIPHFSSTCPSFPASPSFLRGGCQQPLLKCSLQRQGAHYLAIPFPLALGHLQASQAAVLPS